MNLGQKLLRNHQNKKTFTVDIFKDIDKQVISKYNIPTKFNSKDEIDDVLENIIIPKFKDNTKKLKSITNENKRLVKESKNKKIQKILKIKN